jgi:MoxR-like ATPase
VLTPQDVTELQNTVKSIIVEPEALDYAVRLVDATRNPKQARLKDLETLITVGASPRGSLALIAGARALAVLGGQAFVTPDLIKEVAPAVLRHRIIRSFEAEAEQVGVEQIIRTILDKVPVGVRSEQDGSNPQPFPPGPANRDTHPQARGAAHRG